MAGLILSPWPYDGEKRKISRSECVALNAMAEDISSFFLCAFARLECEVFDDCFCFAVEVVLYGESFFDYDTKCGEFYIQAVHEAVEGVVVACADLLVADAERSLGYNLCKDFFQFFFEICGCGFQTFLDGCVFINVG